jgi:hypothetical protein
MVAADPGRGEGGTGLAGVLGSWFAGLFGL